MWKCLICEEKVEDRYEYCWKCGTKKNHISLSFYDLLGLSKDASQAEVETAFREWEEVFNLETFPDLFRAAKKTKEEIYTFKGWAVSSPNEKVVALPGEELSSEQKELKPNKNQRITIIIGVAILLLMFLFPPWKAIGGKVKGYYFIFYPPSRAITIDITRLFVQSLFVIVLTSAGLYFQQQRK
jgi:hypothetical protein